MKKVFLTIITLCFIVSFTACDDNSGKPVSEKDLEDWEEEDFEAALQELDSAYDSMNAQSQDASAPATDFYEAKQEIIDAAWDSGLVQIDDKLVQLPIRLSDWLDLGLDYEAANKSKDYLYVKGDHVSFHLIANGEAIDRGIAFIKETDVAETLEDMDPLIENISMLHKTQYTTMYFPGGLTFDDPYNSIEEKLGKAAEIDENLTYKYGQIGYNASDLSYGINVYVNRNEQTISHFELGKSIQESNREDLKTISFENLPNVQTSDSHNVTFLWASEYKQIPGDVKDYRRVDSILNCNGKKFLMSLSFGMLGQKYASPYEYIEYGDPILDVTDENGMNRTIYNANSCYIVVCSTDEHIFKANLSFKNATDFSEDALTELQDLAFEIANSVQY